MSKTENRVQQRAGAVPDMYINARAVLLSEAQVRGNCKAELVQRQNKKVME